MGADGAPFSPFYGYLKLLATRISGKSKQTLKSPRIEVGTPCSESRALAN